MEKNLEKSLKRYLKRKVKITTAFLVAFLLGSLSTYGKIIAKYDNVSQTVKFYRNDVDVTQEILKSGSITGDLTSGFIWNNDKTLLEGIEIEGSLTSDGKKFTVKNNGKILGDDAKPGEEYAGYGISSQALAKVENNGIIAGNSGGGRGHSSNGFVVEYQKQLSGIDNNGIISGKYGGQYSSGNGIYFDGGETRLTDLNNNGTIKGETTGNDSNGNGIYLNGWSGITNFKNTGLIKGTSYGIKIGNREITNFNNYGVIGGKIGAISKDAGYAKNQNNYGLLLSGSGESVALVESGEKTSEQNGKTIINGVTDDKSALSSLGVSDLNGKIENLIINVAGNKNANGEILNSFNVNNENLTLTNSSINGYENAISLSNGKLTLNGTIVNAGENAVTGSAGDETLNLGANSIINGNIDLGTGQDTISVDSSTVNGKVILNGGKFTSQGTTVINGDISTNGADINIRETSKINGNIDILKGDVTFGDNISVNGNINFGDAEGKIIVGENFGTNNFTGKITGNLANGILGANYVIYDDTGVSNLNNQLQIFNGIKTVQLKDDVNNIVNLSNITASHFSEIRGGTGNDSFIVSSDKIVNMTINGGGNTADGKDTLKLTGALTDENALSGISNIENLHLDNQGNTLNIDNTNGFTSIIGGSGDDNFNNVSINNIGIITGGAGTDTISLNEAVTDNSQINFGTLFGDKSIDRLNLSNGENKLSISEKGDLNIDNIGKVNFGTGKNTLTFTDVKKEGYDLSNKTDIFNGNVTVALNQNSILTGSSLTGDTIKLIDSFIGNDSNVTFKDGDIRFTLSDNISFTDGTKTNYKLDFGKLTNSKDWVKTYSFLNIDKTQNLLTVKSLADLVTESNVTLDKDISNYEENYEILLKKYNTDNAIKTAFNNWTAGELVNASKDMIQDLGEIYSFDNNSREYKGIASSGLLMIGTDMGNQIDNMTFNAIAGGKLAITNTTADGNGKIIFNGTTSFADGIDGRYSRNAVHLDFNNENNNGITIGDILLGAGKNSITIADVSKVNSIGEISSKENVNVILEKLDNSSEKFNTILASAEAGDNNSVEVTENDNTDIKLTTNYTKGELAFKGTGNTVNLGTTYDGNIKLGDNTFNINKSTMSGDIDGGTININETSTMNGKITDGKVNVNKGTWNVAQDTKVSQATLNGGTINLGATNLDTTVDVNSSSNIQGSGTLTAVNLNDGKLSLGDTTKVTNLAFKENGSLGIGENFSGANVTNVTGTAKVDIDYNVKETSNFADQMKNFASGIATLTQNGNTVNLTGVKLSQIISGDGKDTFIMNDTSDLSIKVTDKGTSTDDTLKLGFSTDNTHNFANVSGIENLELSDNGNSLDVTKINGFTSIKGGTSSDIFTTSTDKLAVNLAGGEGEDTLKFAEGSQFDNITNKDILANVSGMEKLELSNANNKVNIDSLDKTNNKFAEITGGTGSDTFISTSSGLNGKTLVGGEGQDSLEMQDGFNNTLNNPFTKVEGIESLKLANAENKVDIDKLGGFTNITGGKGTDIFISTSSGLNGKTLVGGEGQDTLEMKDSFFDNTADNPFTKAEGIETLKLADVTGNKVNIDKLTDFTTINGGNQGDSFTIGKEDKLGITINGGTGIDSLVLNTSVDTSKDLGNISGIENLTFNAKDNKLSFANTDKNKFTSLSFGDTSIGNNLTLDNLDKKDITFGTSQDNIVTVKDSQNIFKHQIAGAGEIKLDKGSSKWTFAEGSKITGTTNLDLGGNNFDFVDYQNKNKGNVSLDGDTLKIKDVSFVDNGKLTISNGAIKIGFDDTITFKDGVNTEFKLSSDGEIGFGKDLAFETYSFINKIGSDLKVTIKKWSDYFTNQNDDRLVYTGRYDEALRKYNTSGNEALTNAFNIFGNNTIVDYIVDNANPKLLYYSDKGEYNVLVAEKGEDILIKSSDTETNKDTKLTFNNISSTGKITIGVTEGNNEVTFGSGEDSSVSIKGENGIDFSSSTTNLTVNIAGEKTNEVSKIVGNDRDNTINLSGNQVTVDNIVLGNGKNTINLNGNTITAKNITAGNGDNTIDLSGEKITVDKINLGTGDNTVKIADISNITKLGSITAKSQDKNSLEISNAIEKSESDKLNNLLNSDIKGISRIELGEKNDFAITKEYGYTGKINLTSENNIEVANGGVLKSLNFTGDKNIVAVNGGTVKGDLDFNGSENKVTLDSGKVLGELSFKGDTNKVDINGETLENSLSFNGNNNQTVVNGGELKGTVDFGTGTGNIFTVNTGNEFNYKVSNADTIKLNKTDKEWTFGSGAKISGDTKVDLNKNTAMLSTTSNGTTVTLDRDFATENVTFNNGEIKFTLSQNTDFSDGVNTKLTVNDGGLIGKDTTLKTYAFLNASSTDKTISVIDWKNLSGDDKVTDTHNIIYNNTIKKFNEDGIYGVLTVWEKDSIVNWIKKNQGEVLGDHTVESNKGDYSGIVSSGTITIDTDKGGKLEDLDIKDLSSKDVVIGNNTTEGDGKVDFTGDTAVSGTITNNSKEDVEISFGGNTNVGTIDSSKSEGKTDINITIDKDKDKFVSGDIIFSDKDGNRLDIEDSSKIENIGKIEGNVDITIDNIGESSDGFNDVLAGANSGLNGNKDNNSITVNGNANVNITNKYDGKLEFKGEENNITVGNSIGTLVTGNGKDTITLEGNVGSLNTGSNDDIINLNVSKFANKEIKVNVDGGEGNDIFNIISSNNSKATEENPNKQPEKSISGTINRLETINVNTDVGFASDLKITGTNNINIAKDKVLSLGIDFDKKDSNGKVIGHSLYNKGIIVNNNDGNIMVDVAETSKDTLISLGEKDSASKLTNDKNLLISGSTNHDIAYDKDNDDIKVNVKEHFIGKEEEVKYGHLDKIYQSIYSADKVGLMAPSSTLKDKTKDEAIKAQLEFYGKIYHSTPYAYTHKISKKSAELITDSLMLNDGMPEVNSWRFGGSIAGREIENSENFYGNNYYNGIDVGNTEVKAETNIYGAYAFGEYGFEEGKAVGFAVAGSKSDTDIGSSSLKGNNIFVSAYEKKKKGRKWSS